MLITSASLAVKSLFGATAEFCLWMAPVCFEMDPDHQPTHSFKDIKLTVLVAFCINSRVDLLTQHELYASLLKLFVFPSTR